jgi:hypothetical protein
VRHQRLLADELVQRTRAHSLRERTIGRIRVLRSSRPCGKLLVVIKE